MRSPSFEQTLTKNGVEFDYIEKLDISTIDTAKSLRNQARLDTPIDEELVSSYAQMDADGYEAPPLVVWRPSNRSKFILCDGNQRLHSKIRNKRTHSDAYLVKSVDPKVIDRITWTFNNMVNGRRLSREECIEHAISYVQKYGVTVVDAAKEWGIPHRLLDDKVRVERAKDKMRERNVKITPTMTDEHIRVLHPILSVGEDVFCEAVQVVSASGMTLEETKDVVREVKRAATVEEKIKKIKEIGESPKVAERKAETKGGTYRAKPNGPREKFCRTLKELRNLVEDFDAKALQPHASEYKIYREMALSVSQRLVRMFGLGTVPQGDQTEAV